MKKTIELGLFVVKNKEHEEIKSYFVAQSRELAFYLFSKMYPKNCKGYTLHFIKWVEVDERYKYRLSSKSLLLYCKEWLKQENEETFLMVSQDTETALKKLENNNSLPVCAEREQKRQNYALIPIVDFTGVNKETKEMDSMARLKVNEINSKIHQDIVRYAGDSRFTPMEQRKDTIDYFHIKSIIVRMTEQLRGEKGNTDYYCCVKNKLQELVFFDGTDGYKDIKKHIYKEVIKGIQKV